MTWRYRDFEPGREIRSQRLTIPVDARQMVKKAFPDLSSDEGDIELTIAMLMRAYTDLVAPRPPGNIHAEQRMRIFRPLVPGEEVSASICCVEKEQKSGRNWVLFRIRISEAEAPVAQAVIRMVWAQ